MLMLLLVLGLLDILVGFALLTPDAFSSVIFYLGIGILVKGLVSLGGSVFHKNWFDWMGMVDLVAGVLLLSNFQIPYFWALPILKGLYTVLVIWKK